MVVCTNKSISFVFHILCMFMDDLMILIVSHCGVELHTSSSMYM